MTRSAPPAGAPAADRQGPPDHVGARFMPFAGQSFDAATRTIECVMSAGVRVRRWFGFEELDMSAAAVDLGRVAMGQVRFLNHHNQWEMNAVLGVVESARLENGQLVGRVRLAETDAGREAEGMISRGELTGLSIGYGVRKWMLAEILEGDLEVWRAAEWELFELSLVSVPADPNAGVRSAVPNPSTPSTPAAAGGELEDPDMRRSLMTSVAAVGALAALAPPNDQGGASAAPEARAAEPLAAPAPVAAAAAAVTVARFTASEALDFIGQARSFGDIVATRADELVRQNERGEIGVETARSALLQAAAEQQRAATAPVAAGAGARAGDEAETTRGQVVDALVSRALGRAPAAGGENFRGMTLLEIAGSRAGLSPRERDANVILRAAHTTSDFPIILEAVANRVMMDRYELATPTYRPIARQRNLRDFKATNLLRIGDFPTLLAYQEDGEIKAGTINEGKESVQLASYGRILRLSRQAIVNDDLGAFDDVIGSIGTTVALFENATFWAMRAQNSGLGPKLSDNKSLFHADHNNYTSSGTAIGIASLSVGRKAIRTQKNLDQKIMNLSPRFLVVGPDNETIADQITASISPALAGSVNPFSGKLEVITEGSISGYGWDLYADPGQAPAYNYGYLESSPGPRVMTHEPFNTDGMAFRVTLDFYCGATDYRPGYHNAGAAPA